jgi:hypothetical protein
MTGQALWTSTACSRKFPFLVNMQYEEEFVIVLSAKQLNSQGLFDFMTNKHGLVYLKFYLL